MFTESEVCCDFCQRHVLRIDDVGMEVGRCDDCREYCDRCGEWIEEAGRTGLCDDCLPCD